MEYSDLTTHHIEVIAKIEGCMVRDRKPQRANTLNDGEQETLGDLSDYGLVIVGTYPTAFVSLTDEGWRIAGMYRRAWAADTRPLEVLAELREAAGVLPLSVDLGKLRRETGVTFLVQERGDDNAISYVATPIEEAMRLWHGSTAAEALAAAARDYVVEWDDELEDFRDEIQP